MKAWALWFMVLAGIADLVTTWTGISDGATEQNVIACMFGGSLVSVMIVASLSKVIGVLIVVLVLKPPTSNWVAVIIGMIWLFGGAVNNVTQICLN